METPDSLLIQCSIVIRSQFEGIHCWPKAPEEVSFLRNKHRHLFKVEAEFQVSHADRDLEFFTLKKKIDGWLFEIKHSLTVNSSQSCEMMAEKILRNAITDGYQCDRVSVSEDGENDGVARFVGLM